MEQGKSNFTSNKNMSENPTDRNVNNKINSNSKKNQKTLMKEKRRQQYEDMSKECANLNISEIRVEDFAEARKRELNKFIHILNNKYSSKVGFQLLPKHMRRRQMSHNPFRIPIRARLSNLNVNVKSKCRKHKKKKMYLKNSIIRRAIKNNWLETHIWHAKRFKMKKIFGYNIAINRRDKGFKACYRYGKYDACIYENSYTNYLIINTCEDKVISIFAEIIKTFTISKLDNLIKYKAYRLNVYNNTTYRLIGPVTFLPLSNVILISYHPTMKDELLEIFKEFQFQSDKETSVSYSNKMNNFGLFGPRIGSMIYKIIKSLSVDDGDDPSKLFEFISEEEFERQLHYLIEGQVILFKIRKPESQFKMNELTFNKITNKILNESECKKKEDEKEKDIFNEDKRSQFINYVDNINKLNCKFISLHLSSNGNYQLNKKLENNNINSPADDYEMKYETERTVFMHRKNVNLDNLNKKLSKSIKNYSKNQVLFMQNKSKNKRPNKTEGTTNNRTTIENSNVDQENLKNFLSDKEVTYLILVKNQITKKDGTNGSENVYPIYSLIFPSGYSTDLFRRFIYLETRAVGLKEFNYYLTDSTTLIFPNDYPSTASYTKYTVEKTLGRIEKYSRYPASKRMNYQKIGNSFPFYAAWHKLCLDKNKDKFHQLKNFNEDVEVISNLLNKITIRSQFTIQNLINNFSNKTILIPIYIEMDGKGIPYHNSHICLPNEDDISNLKICKENKINKFNFVNKILTQVENINNIVGVYQRNKEKIIEPKHYTSAKNKNFNIDSKTMIELEYHRNPTSLYTSDILNEDFTIKLGDSTIRNIIGFVTSGGFSYANSKGIGKGFILLEQYEKLVKLKRINNMEKIYVLVRNKNSRIYYYANIQLLTI